MANFAEKLQEDIDRARQNEADIENRKLDNPPNGYHRCSSINDVLVCHRKEYFKCVPEYSKQIAKWYSPYIVGLFEVGNAIELFAKRLLENCGYEIRREQRAVSRKELLDAKISGSIDFIIIKDGVECLADVKSINDYHFEKIEKWQDLLTIGAPWMENWVTQLNTYQYDQEAKYPGQDAVFVFVNKSSGEIRIIPMPLDIELAEMTIQECKEVNRWIEDNKIPPAIHYCNHCENCKFRGTACLPDIEFLAQDNLIEDQGLIDIINKINALKKETLPAALAIQKDYDSLKKSLKQFFDPFQVGSYSCAGMELIVKEITRKPTAGCTYRQVTMKDE